MNANDLVVGVDFTGVISPNGGDFNNGVNLATLTDEGNDTEGRGLLFTTTDTAANTPNVPDPTLVGLERVKRFKWVRRPFAGEDIKSAKNYTWNDDATNDITYLKWVEDSVDLTTVTNLANSALATSNNAVAEAQVANDTANAATTAINAATIAANAAVVTANTANTNATAAVVTANTANTTAITANATANAALLAINTPAAITNRLLPSATPFQQIRTKFDLSAVEWFSPYKAYMKFTEAYAKGTDNPTAPAVGKNTRLLNTSDNNAGGYVSLNAVTGVITLIAVGYYKIKAYAIINRAGANPLNHQLVIANNGTNATLLTGSAMLLTNGNTNNVMASIEGLVNAAALDTIRLDHYTSTATGIVLGKAANVHPDAGGLEVYTCIELEFLGA